MTHLEFTVGGESAGSRLDLFLAGAIPGESRSHLQRLIREGRVCLGDRAARPNTLLRAGERVSVEVPPPSPATPEPEPIPLVIVYEDADLAVVDKPAGMVVHPGAGHPAGTLVNALLHHLDGLSGVGGEERPGIVHRLDRGTSGLIVVAKHDRSHRELSRQFHDREVEKEYVALVWGAVHAGRRIDLPIGRDPANRQKMSARARRARTAVTRVTGSERIGGFTLVKVAIATGRTHQIRVHLSAIGHPVVGDGEYGGVRRHVAADERPVQRLERPFLHAARLRLTHPSDGRRFEFTSPMPPDLSDLIDDLRAHAAPDRHPGRLG